MIFSKKSEDIHKYLWKIILIFSVIPFVILCFYTHPSIHDAYLTANALLGSNKIEFIKSNYLSWTGRYTELLLKSIFSPLIYENGLFIEKFLTLSILILFYICFYFLCIYFADKKDRIVLSLLLMVLFINGLTDVGSVLYWSGGYTAYTAGNILFIGFIIFFISYKKYNKKTPFVLSCVCAFAAIGSYDSIMIFMLWIVLSNIIYAYFYKSNFSESVILFMISVCGALVSILSPGNMMRAASINEGVVLSFSRIFTSGLKSLFFASGTAISWIDSLLLITGTMLIIQIANKKLEAISLFAKINPLIVFIWLFLGISISVFPSMFAYQAVWSHTWQSIYLFFLIGFIICFYILYKYINNKYNVERLVMHKYMILVCQVLFGFIVLLSSNSNTNIAYLDLLKAPDFQRRALQRDANMQLAAKQKKAGEVSPLFLSNEAYMIPQTLYTIEYNEADARAFAAYHGVDSVLINRCNPE